MTIEYFPTLLQTINIIKSCLRLSICCAQVITGTMKNCLNPPGSTGGSETSPCDTTHEHANKKAVATRQGAVENKC